MTTAQIIVAGIGALLVFCVLFWRLDVNRSRRRSQRQAADPVRSLVIEGRPDRRK